VLVRHFTGKYAERNSVPCSAFTPAAIDDLKTRPWKGNVRELENFIERVVVLSQNSIIDRRDLPCLDVDEPRQRIGPPFCPLREIVDDYIQTVVDYVQGHQGRASQILGISRRTLYRRLRQCSSLDLSEHLHLEIHRDWLRDGRNTVVRDSSDKQHINP